MGMCSRSRPYRLRYSCIVSYKSEARYDRPCQSVHLGAESQILFCVLNTGVVLPRGAPIWRERVSVRCQKLQCSVHAVCPASVFLFFREWRWWTRGADQSLSCRPEDMQLITVVLLYGLVPRSSLPQPQYVGYYRTVVFSLLFVAYHCHANKINAYQQITENINSIQFAVFSFNFLNTVPDKFFLFM
jgi:hypothetical protein